MIKEVQDDVRCVRENSFTVNKVLGDPLSTGEEQGFS